MTETGSGIFRFERDDLFAIVRLLVRRLDRQTDVFVIEVENRDDKAIVDDDSLVFATRNDVHRGAS